MNLQITISQHENTFRLVINGIQHTYPNDKEGKRQAILDGLNAIETVDVGEDTYLPSNEALQVVAAVLYPDGIQTDTAYERVCEVAEKACAHMGYGPEVELGPPAVPFSQRGSYRKRYPPVDEQVIQDELERVGTGSTYPRQEVACTVLWNKAGLAVYGRHWSGLTSAQQEMVQRQVDEIVEQAGWTRDDSSTAVRYIKPLPIDEDHARSRLSQFMGQQNGRPVSVSNVIYQIQVGAYGRGFYVDDLAPTLERVQRLPVGCEREPHDRRDRHLHEFRLGPACSGLPQEHAVERLRDREQSPVRREGKILDRHVCDRRPQHEHGRSSRFRQLLRRRVVAVDARPDPTGPRLAKLDARGRAPVPAVRAGKLKVIGPRLHKV
jgi:hypothetical protein